MVKRQGKYTKKVQIFVEPRMHDLCMELINNRIYNSLAELVRDGIDMALDKATGMEDMRRQEIANRFGPEDMNETRIKIDGTIMRMRVNARWWHLHAATMLQPLIDDLHIPQPLSNIEEKYGTRIELYNLHDQVPNTEEGYKDTYAYKLEHGLLGDENQQYGR